MLHVPDETWADHCSIRLQFEVALFFVFLLLCDPNVICGYAYGALLCYVLSDPV